MLSYRTKCSVGVLYELGVASVVNKKLTTTELMTRLGFDRSSLNDIISRLRRGGWVDTVNGGHILAISLSNISLYDLVKVVDDGFVMGGCLMDGWPKKDTYRFIAAMQRNESLACDFKSKLQNVLLSQLFP